MAAAQESGSLQVAGRASLQSAVGHDANLTNRSKSRRQNNNVDFIFDQNDFSGLKAEQKVFETGGLKKQPHRRRSRTDSKIAFLQRGRRGRRGKRSSPQHRYSPHQSFSSAAPSAIPEPADGEYPAASHPEYQQLLPDGQANSIAQPNTQLQPASQLQPSPTPSPHLPVALCHDSNARINDFSGSPYDLPHRVPRASVLESTDLPKRSLRPHLKPSGRFRHLPPDQRPAARAALKAIIGINPRLSTGSALTATGQEPKQRGGAGQEKALDVG